MNSWASTTISNVSSLCLDKTTQATVSCRDFRRTIARFCCTAEHPTCLHFQAAVAAIRLVMNKAITSNLSTMHALMVHRIPKFQTYQNQRLWGFIICTVRDRRPLLLLLPQSAETVWGLLAVKIRKEAHTKTWGELIALVSFSCSCYSLFPSFDREERLRHHYKWTSRRRNRLRLARKLSLGWWYPRLSVTTSSRMLEWRSWDHFIRCTYSK